MTLTEIRAAQHDDVPTQSDAQLAQYLATVTPAQAVLDRTAHATPTEWVLLARLPRRDT